MCSQRAGVAARSRSPPAEPRVVGPAPSYRVAHDVLRPTDSPGRGSEGEEVEICGNFLDLEEIKAILKERLFPVQKMARMTKKCGFLLFFALFFFSEKRLLGKC